MSIDNIFEEWKRNSKCDNFIKDGIINNSLYKNTSLKILSILQSPPNFLQTNDFCNEIEEEFFYEYDADENQKINRYHPIKGVFFNLARWIYAINKLHKNKIPLFSDVCCQSIKKYDFAQFFRNSAVIFFNKCNDKKKYSKRKLFKTAMRDNSLLNREITDIKPNLIICGNTFEIYRKLYEKDIFEQIQNTNFYLHKIYGSKEIRYVFDFVNPDTNKKSDKLFDKVVSDFSNFEVKNILSKFKS